MSLLSPSRLASPMRLLCVVLTLSLLSACGGPLSLLTGGGPNVAANVQAGQENNQAIVQVDRKAPTVTVRPKSRVDTVDQSTTTNNELPEWLWVVFTLLFVVGWVTDTPGTMLRRKR